MSDLIDSARQRKKPRLWAKFVCHEEHSVALACLPNHLTENILQVIDHGHQHIPERLRVPVAGHGTALLPLAPHPTDDPEASPCTTGLLERGKRSETSSTSSRDPVPPHRPAVGRVSRANLYR